MNNLAATPSFSAHSHQGGCWLKGGGGWTDADPPQPQPSHLFTFLLWLSDTLAGQGPQVIEVNSTGQ